MKRENQGGEENQQGSLKRNRVVSQGNLPEGLLRYILQFAVGSLQVNDLRFVTDLRQANKMSQVNTLFRRLVGELGFDPLAFSLSRPPEDFLARMGEEDFSTYFQAFDAMSEFVIENFPPRAWAYLALGRSATPLLGQLGRRCPNARLINMPLGQISIGLAQDQAEWIENQKVRGFVFRHFDQFVAPDKLGGRSKVLVLDYGDWGKALYTIYHWLNAYYLSKEAQIEVATYSMSKEVPQALRDNPGEELGNNVRPLPREHVAIAGPETPGIDTLIGSLFGGDLKKLAIDLYESLAANDLISTGKGASASQPQNFYRLLRLLKEAEETAL